MTTIFYFTALKDISTVHRKAVSLYQEDGKFAHGFQTCHKKADDPFFRESTNLIHLSDACFIRAIHFSQSKYTIGDTTLKLNPILKY